MKSEHGLKGHLNIYVKDHDSVVTGFGAHDRVVCFHPQYDYDYDSIVMHCRVDYKWGLGAPTLEQILTVARKDQDVRGKFEMASQEAEHDGHCTYYVFTKV